MTLDDVKAMVARSKGYSNWEEMIDWFIDHNFTVNAVILTELAWKEVAELYKTKQ